MGTAAARMTVDDYYAITREGDRKQLVDGRIIVNEPWLSHWWIQSRLCGALQTWVAAAPGRGRPGPAADVRLDDHNLFGPDVIWIAERHLPPPGQELLDRVPDICVEIRSRSTWRYDVGAKRDAYERGGCPELWLVDDRGAVHIHRRSSPDSPVFDVVFGLVPGDVLASPQLPGFELPLDELFDGV